jgi:N-methylhydantoinase B
LDTPGGGGLGNPLDRDPQRVLKDVRNGYVTRKRALEDYRVVIDCVDADYLLNEKETAQLRAQA